MFRIPKKYFFKYSIKEIFFVLVLLQIWHGKHIDRGCSLLHWRRRWGGEFQFSDENAKIFDNLFDKMDQMCVAEPETQATRCRSGYTSFWSCLISDCVTEVGEKFRIY